MHTVITENDESAWDDNTGVLYHFPKRYLKYLEPGTEVIYYKGSLKSKKYADQRLSDKPHYFGVARLGKVYLDKDSDKGDWFGTIEGYHPFSEPVFAKNTDDSYLELIPENRKSNYWRDGVRPISEENYQTILSLSKLSDAQSSPATDSMPTNDLFNQLESIVEGKKSQRFVTTYERDPRLRKMAIAIHGVTCKVCGFNYEEHYGDYAKGMIQVHHIRPVSEFGGEKLVDPENDLIPLCANCHSVVHRRKDSTLSISELKSMYGLLRD